jgi:hypothetical protein
MKKLSSLLLFMTVFTGCEFIHSTADKIPNGIYAGTFQRQLAFGGGAIVQVSLNFKSDTWTGSTSNHRYPALCNGTYVIKGQKIIFSDKCVWTADFDWTLILNGEYDFTINGDQLTISRDYSGPTTDAYKDNYLLTKQSK